MDLTEDLQPRASAAVEGGAATNYTFNVKENGATGNGVVGYDGVVSGTTLTSASSTFTPAINGKLLYVIGAASVVTCTYVDAHTLTLSATTVTGSERIFYWGEDNTAAFAATAAAALAAAGTIASFPNGGDWSIPSAPQVVLQVPAGIYLLATMPDVNNAHVIWEFMSGAVVAPINNLPGKHIYPGVKVGSQHFGLKDTACTFSVITGTPAQIQSGAQICGFVDPSDLSWYVNRDSVALYTWNSGRGPTLTKTNTDFSNTTAVLATPLTSAEVDLLRIGMVIDTNHTPYKYSGLITGWAADGSSITVSGWYRSTGTPSTTTYSPANNATIYVNPFTKIWNQDSVLILYAGSHENAATGYEFDIFNYKAAYNPSTELPNVRGIEMSSAGPYQCAAGYQLIGDWYYGFDCRGSGYAAYSSKGTQTYHFHSASFKVTQAGAVTANTSVTAPIHYAGTASWRSGNGSPEGIVTAPVGSLYTRLDGGAGTTLYVKESTAGNTGWVAK